MTTWPTIFKWQQTEPQLILCAVRWYLRYSLSLRDVEELLDVARRRSITAANRPDGMLARLPHICSPPFAGYSAKLDSR